MADNDKAEDKVMGRADLQMYMNAVLTRSQIIEKFLDPRRDVYAECGYPTTEQLNITYYQKLYEREGIASRVVEVMPMESWQSIPRVFETDEVDNETPFEKAWNDLSISLRGKSRYQGEDGHPIWEKLERADVLSGIGDFGVILIGLDDGLDLAEEAVPREGQQVIFIRAFDESLVSISSYESDASNPRFGQPTQYSVTINDPRHIAAGDSGVSRPESGPQSAAQDSTTKTVHWSRIIHVADNLGSSEVFGVSRLRNQYNRIADLIKLYSGSGEMYWKGAFPGLSIETHPQLGADVDLDETAIKAKMLEYEQGLSRYLAMAGASANSLAPQVVDPSKQIEVQLDALCISIGVPKRIFIGSERGELASSQDASSWNDRLRHRQNSYITPRIIVPFIDRVIELKVLPEPAEENGYSIEWPDLEALTEAEQAAIVTQRTEAMSKYVSGGVESLIAPQDYLVREMHYTQDEAEEILDNAIELLEEKEAELEEAMALEREEFGKHGVGVSKDGKPFPFPDQQALTGISPSGDKVPPKPKPNKKDDGEDKKGKLKE